MASTRDDFEHWLFEMDDRLEEFVSVLPTDISTKMDYSAESLSVLEGWLMTQDESVNDILKESEKPMLDMVTRYVGETLRKQKKRGQVQFLTTGGRMARLVTCPESPVQLLVASCITS